MVGESKEKFKKYIKELDTQIKFSSGKNDNYYVVHFPKKKFAEEEFEKAGKTIMYPRNVVTRKKAKQGARELIYNVGTGENTESVWHRCLF